MRPPAPRRQASCTEGCVALRLMNALRRTTTPDHLTPLAYAYRLIARRVCSERELQAKLEARGFTAGAVARVVSRLKDQRYVDDAWLARSLASRLREKGYGGVRVRAKLVQRGIAPALVEEVVRESAPESHELETARRLLARRFPQGLGERRQAGRAFRFLVTRGFSPDLAGSLVSAGRAGSQDRENAQDDDRERDKG